MLLPEEFYLATILNQKIENPCKINENNLCKEYRYLNVSNFPMVSGVGGFITNENRISNFYSNREVQTLSFILIYLIKFTLLFSI